MITSNEIARQYNGLSTDEKPTADIENGSLFLEMDTSKTFIFDKDNEIWREL